MAETRNWLEMPDEIMGQMILKRIGAIEILKSAQKVCTTWRRICKNPAMWKVVCINRDTASDYEKLFNQMMGVNLFSSDAGDTDSDVEKLIKQAVHRSCGELIDITLDGIKDDLLDYISRCSSKLKRLCLMTGGDITGCGLSNALKHLPHLETLELIFYYISIDAKDIEVIGHNCPQLKSFKMEAMAIDFDSSAHSIANSMPALRHLQLVGASTVNDDVIRAILNGCLHLESLDLSRCFHIHLDSNLEKLCRERIKDFKCKRNVILEYFDESDTGFNDYDYDGFNDLCYGGGIDLSDAAAVDADDDADAAAVDAYDVD